MNISLASYWLVLAILLVLQFMLTAMHYSLTSVSRKVLRERYEGGNSRAQHTLRLSENASALLTTQQYISILLTACITGLLVMAPADELTKRLQETQLDNRWASILAYVILLPPSALLILLVGHQLPVAIMSGRVESFAIFVTPLMRVLVHVLSPILKLTQTISQNLGRWLGGSGKVTMITEEEIITLLDAGSEEGVIEIDEKTMIYSVFKFGDTLVREVMVPRIDMVALEVDATLDKALDVIMTAGHSRIPVYEDTVDNIRGILYAKDLLAIWRNKQTDFSLPPILREPYFVPETKKAVELLQELRTRETHIAIVSDEYGGIAGLVTVEDLIEEIVGEIKDEYDFLEEAPYEMLSETEYIFSGGFDLDDFNERLDVSLPTDENDTLGGYIFTELGKVPQVGDKVFFNHTIEMEVLALKGKRRIHKVRVLKIEKQNEQRDETKFEKQSEQEAEPEIETDL